MSAKLSTKELSILHSKNFISALSNSDKHNQKNSTILYVVLGGEKSWSDENNPPSPDNTDQTNQFDIKRNFIGGKKVNTEDVSHVIKRYDWTSGTVYNMYKDTSVMDDLPFYVLTNEMNVYKCLDNAGGVPSTVKPTGFSSYSFVTSDGYMWKYMYTVSLGDADKFLTNDYIPVKNINVTDGSIEGGRQLNVQNSASNGSIQAITVHTEGSEYSWVSNGIVETADSTQIKLSSTGSNPPSSIDNFYNGSSLYIISGTGAGQLRRIIDYSGATKTFVVNTAFQTIANTDSRVIISPTVTIIGDGSGAKAYAKVNNGDGSIANVSVISVGSQYTKAKAIITANTIHGSGATANVIISPIGGHSADPVRELKSDKLMINVKFRGNEGLSANGNGYIPSNTDFRTITLLKDPILKVDANNNTTAVEHIANTSNSPATLRFLTRTVISYLTMNGSSPVNSLAVGDVLTNERNRLRAELGELEFVTELGSTEREAHALSNAVQGANGHIVYIRKDEVETDPSFYTVYLNNVESYGDYPAFTKDDVILTDQSETKIATVEAIAGPEANTYSGQILFTENLTKITRSLDQIEDIKIVLDFKGV